MTPEPALLPLALKLAYSGFLLVLVPVYWRHYGPTNFLYFCDVALLLTGVGLWWESPLLISMATVGILLPQLFWLLDLASRALGRPISGMTAYMFDATRSRFLRGLSLFHGWLPLLLLWLVAQLGYDPRAWWMWSLLAAVLVLISYLALPPPSPQRGTRPVNVNYVHGLSDERPQTWMPRWAWLGVCLLGFPLVLYLPAHLLLQALMPAAR
jgi:hypothetical protein